MLAEAGDLLAGFQRVVDATWTVVGVDGAGLTLAHKDGPPRWVATSDPAMELLEQIQQEFGEGPCLVTFAEDRVVAVEDQRRALRWDRIAAAVSQLQVRGLLSVPVRLRATGWNPSIPTPPTRGPGRPRRSTRWVRWRP
jgi:hypothetical protein